MTCFFNPFFNVYITVAKSGFTFCFCYVKEVEQTRTIECDTDSATPTACGCFDTNWIADFFCKFGCFFGGFNGCIFVFFVAFPVLATGNEFQTCLCYCLKGLNFISHSIDIVNRRTDEFNLVCLTYFSELCIFSEKTCPRVYCINIGKVSDSSDVCVFKITFG